MLRWWLIESRPNVSACPAIPRKVGGEWMWLHPRFLTEPLDLEPHVQSKFREFIRPADTVLDIGAYVGMHTLLAAKLTGPRGRVFAFEPSPSNFQYLDYHCRHNGRHASAFQNLVSDRAGERLPFHLLNEGDSTSNSMTFGESIGAETRTIEVESVTVDGFCEAREARPAFIKIDVEGAESLVLQGATRILREVRPTIILALHPQWLPAGVTPDDIRRILDGVGYDLLTLEGEPARNLELAEYICRPRV
jgi:FkbM family methyltransferase